MSSILNGIGMNVLSEIIVTVNGDAIVQEGNATKPVIRPMCFP